MTSRIIGAAMPMVAYVGRKPIAAVAPPISPPLPQVYVEELVAKYRVIDTTRQDLSVFGGVGFEQQYYEDDQDLPNRVRADFGPMFIFGVNWNF